MSDRPHRWNSWGVCVYCGQSIGVGGSCRLAAKAPPLPEVRIEWYDVADAHVRWTSVGLSPNYLYAYEHVDTMLRGVMASNAHNGEVVVKAAIRTWLASQGKVSGRLRSAIASVRRVEVFTEDEHTVAHIHTTIKQA